MGVPPGTERRAVEHGQIHLGIVREIHDTNRLEDTALKTARIRPGIAMAKFWHLETLAQTMKLPRIGSSKPRGPLA